tara:strand:+ start:964 stop:1836 length:873 start_codon:yes stop_codon:yes gene_type:complete
MNSIKWLNLGLQGIVLASALSGSKEAHGLEKDLPFLVSVYGEPTDDFDSDKSEWVYDDMLGENGYDVVQLDFAGDDNFSYERALLNQIKRVYRQRGAIPIILFNLHGTPASMALNQGRECSVWKEGERFQNEDCYIDVWDTKFFEELKEYMDPEGIIVLYSCSTGQGDANLATRMSEVTGLPVFAPTEDASFYGGVMGNLGRETAEALPYIDFDLEGNFEGIHFYQTYIDPEVKRIIWRIGEKDYPMDNAVREITSLVDGETGEDQALEMDLLTETFRVERGRNYLLNIN